MLNIGELILLCDKPYDEYFWLRLWTVTRESDVDRESKETIVNLMLRHYDPDEGAVAHTDLARVSANAVSFLRNSPRSEWGKVTYRLRYPREVASEIYRVLQTLPTTLESIEFFNSIYLDGNTPENFAFTGLTCNGSTNREEAPTSIGELIGWISATCKTSEVAITILKALVEFCTFVPYSLDAKAQRRIEFHDLTSLEVKLSDREVDELRNVPGPSIRAIVG